MAIEIRGLPGGIVQNASDSGKAQTEQNTSTGASSSKPAGTLDQFSLTESASRLQFLENSVKNLSVVDMPRVEETPRALATGSFQIEPVSIAGKILEMERSFS